MRKINLFENITNRIISTIILFFVIAMCSYSQKVDMEKLSDLKPRSIGPAGMSGRITAIEAIRSNPNVIYVGTASGGLWKSETGGLSWKPIFDKQKVLSIGSLAINPNNPDEIWAGTGEGNPRNSLTGGYGIYKSIDGGENWKCMGLEETRNIHRVLINPQNTDIIYAGAIGSPWGDSENRGVYKTTDGGKTWKKVLYINEKTGPGDLVMDPSNPNKIIAGMWEHRRLPWFFESGGKGSGIYISHDGGGNWKKVTSKDGIPEGNIGRTGLAIAPSDANRVY
ncbi:WD40/YVTN/BNR-like repeat-containing protein, partial [Bacteroidota bacterium]